VDYTTSDGTALAASDYTASTATPLTISTGNTTGSITVLVNADTMFEPNETLTLTLSNPSINASLSPSTIATGTIINDDVGGMNDTGITTWGDAAVNNATAIQTLFPGQDADHGRDALAGGIVVGGLTKVGASSNTSQGFDFTKLDSSGAALASQSAVYGTTAWDCVQDHVTGLYWEVKTMAGAGGLRDANHTYTWYNSTGINDGGGAGTASGGICVDGVGGANCDTEKYVVAANAAGICGFTDWRLPTKLELRSIVDYSVAAFGTTIDTGYFPNTISRRYWSASPNADSTIADAWNINFNNGFDSKYPKTNNFAVRLVRGGQ
jgi:hypothetical protein